MDASGSPASGKGAVLGPTIAGAGLLAATLIAYAPFLGTGFAATDSLPLVETSRLTSLADVAHQFSQPVMAGTRFVLGEVVYRPFVSFTFGLDYLLWGQNAFGYHLTNLGLHVVGVFGVWALLANLGLRWWSSLFGAALFALHPVGVASVPVVARRDSVLPVVAFTVGAAVLLLADRSTTGRRWSLMGSSGLLFAIALLSKESTFAAMGMLPMLLASQRLGRGESARQVLRHLRVVVPFLVLAAVVFVIRLAVLGGLGGAPNDNTALSRLDWDRYSQTLGAFTRDLLWPFAPLAASTREVWPRLAAVLVVGAAATLAWLPRRQASLAAAGLLWIVGFAAFCVALKIGTIAWLGYFVLVGVALLFAATLEGATRPEARTTRRRTAGAAVALVGVAVFAFSALWASPLVRQYYQWRVAGGVTGRLMQGLTTCVDRSGQAAPIITLRGLPGDLDDNNVDTSLLGVTLFEDYTIEAGLNLAFPGRPLSVVVGSTDVLRNAGDSLAFACTPTADGVEFTTTY